MTLRKQALLLGAVSMLFAFSAADVQASPRPLLRCFQPFSWRQAPARQHYQYDASTNTYRRYSVEPGADVPTTASPAVRSTPSQSPSAGDNARRRLRPGSGF